MQLFAIDEDYIENGAAKFGNDLPMLAKSSSGAEIVALVWILDL